MTTQDILTLGEVIGEVPTQTLEETRSVAQWQIDGFKDCNWTIAPEAIARLNRIISQIDTLLNRRRGLDGMTPVQP